METTAQTVMIATIFIWCGLIIGISFTEAWLKFRAPGVTLAIGLGIGRIVFSASNILQLCFTLLMLLIAFSIKTAINTGLIIAVSLLLIQTFWQ